MNIYPVINNTFEIIGHTFEIIGLTISSITLIYFIRLTFARLIGSKFRSDLGNSPTRIIRLQ